MVALVFTGGGVTLVSLVFLMFLGAGSGEDSEAESSTVVGLLDIVEIIIVNRGRGPFNRSVLVVEKYN